MDQENRCPQCGAELAADVPQGLCPACLLKRGLESQTGGGEASQPGSAAYVPPTPAELAPLFPDLEILELVGRGGMGVVYKARQKHLNRLVALKILSPSVGEDPAFADRFAREAQAMAMLSHPHIVAVHDFGQAGGMYYFLMEFVDGLNLRRLLDTSKLAPQEALAIVPQICDALQYAHDKGVVHRDIKPENVLLDKEGQVKIADFGLAKLMGREAKDFTLTGAGQVMGTPNYMAPEQIEHPQDVDHRADIYSLGVVFYQMLTGELPLGRFAPPSRKVQIDVRLDEVVLRALEKEPDLRYQQASEIKTRVESIVTSPFDAGDMQRAPPREPASERGDAASRDRTPPPAPGDYAATEAAQLQVHAPAIGLLVVGILDLVAIPIVVFAMLAWHLSRTPPQPSDTLLLVPFGVLVFAFAAGSFVIFAARRMKRLESYGCAVAACFLAMLVTPANLLGLAIGIWALVVLSRAKVSAAFERQKKLKPARPTATPSQRMLGIAAIVLCAVSFPLALLGGMGAVAHAIFITFQIIALILGLLGRRSLAGKTAALLTLIGISLFAVGVVPTSPPDISGNWQGEDWGQVTLTQTAPGQYTGTYTDTVGKEKEPGKIDLKWSRIERRFNGAWCEGDDRFGDLSVRLVDNEIRGALTIDPKSKINPATPRLADLVWTRTDVKPSPAAASSSPGAASGNVSSGTVSSAIDVVSAPMPREASAAAPAWVRHNILKNSDVEAGDGTPNDWQQGPPVQGVTYSWCKTKSAAFTGYASLYIEKTAQSYSPIAQWSQTVDRPANLRSMAVSAQVKAENMTQGMVDVSFLDASGKLISHQCASFIGRMGPQPPRTTHDWTLYSGRVEIPPQAKKLSIGLQLFGPGKVWFDNIYAGTAATSDPAAEQRFQHLLAGYRKQQNRLLTGVFRAQGVKAVEDEQSPQRTYQGPVHIFGAFDYKNGKGRFDWEEVGALSTKYCKTARYSAHYIIKPPLHPTKVELLPPEARHGTGLDRCRFFDVRALGLGDYNAFRSGTSLEEVCRGYLKDSPVDSSDEGSGVVKLAWMLTESQRRSVWFAEDKGYQPVKNVREENNLDMGEEWMIPLHESAAIRKQVNGVWVPTEFHLVYRKIVGRSPNPVPANYKPKYATVTYTLSFDWEAVNAPVPEKYFTYEDFHCPKGTPVTDRRRELYELLSPEQEEKIRQILEPGDADGHAEEGKSAPVKEEPAPGGATSLHRPTR